MADNVPGPIPDIPEYGPLTALVYDKDWNFLREFGPNEQKEFARWLHEEAPPGYQARLVTEDGTGLIPSSDPPSEG